MSEVEAVLATVRGEPNVRAFAYYQQGASQPTWFSAQVVHGARFHDDEDVTHRVPLRLVDESTHVVIDPKNIAEFLDAFAEQEVKYNLRSALQIKAAFRSMLKHVEPPIPPLPTGEYLVQDARGVIWEHKDIEQYSSSRGWEKLWKDHGPLRIWRVEEADERL